MFSVLSLRTFYFE